MALLDKVRMACRVTTNTFDAELTDLINSALADMQITDITNLEETDPLIERAVLTFCKMNFGFATLSNDQFARLQDSYNEQKKQLLMSSSYTDWGGSDA